MAVVHVGVRALIWINMWFSRYLRRTGDISDLFGGSLDTSVLHPGVDTLFCSITVRSAAPQIAPWEGPGPEIQTRDAAV